MLPNLTYLSAYSADLQQQIQSMIDNNSLGDWLRSKYTHTHDIANDGDLRDYTMALKQRFMRQSKPLSKVAFDGKIHTANALGLHCYIPRIQGNKIKTKNEIRISTLFKTTPEAFLNMIVVHELAHLKHKQHDKNFYQLCTYMQPNYHQLEFEVRVYLTELERTGSVFN